MNLNNLTKEEIDEFTWLMKEYGAEDDKHLTSDAKRLRLTIIGVVRSVLGEEGGVASAVPVSDERTSRCPTYHCAFREDSPLYSNCDSCPIKKPTFDVPSIPSHPMIGLIPKLSLEDAKRVREGSGRVSGNYQKPSGGRDLARSLVVDGAAEAASTSRAQEKEVDEK